MLGRRAIARGMREYMKYIRYLLLYSFDIGLIVVCILLFGLDSVSPITCKAISITGIISIITYLSHQIRDLKNEVRHPIDSCNGVMNYYIKQESIYRMSFMENWQEKVKDLIHYVRADMRKMALAYEDDKSMIFETEDEIGKGTKKRNRNKILLEFAKGINDEIVITAHKKKRFIELSNRENEELIGNIVRILNDESTTNKYQDIYKLK